ncbi:MAG: hypothetical protein NVS9B9_08670 [Ktedonobacteraceae bacterium]
MDKDKLEFLIGYGQKCGAAIEHCQQLVGTYGDYKSQTEKMLELKNEQIAHLTVENGSVFKNPFVLVPIGIVVGALSVIAVKR